nr:lysozyme [uncultured Albidiferax sp.]
MADYNRTLIAALMLSAAGLVGIAVDEGYTAKAVPDPVHGTKVPTYGFGTTGGVKMGDTITPVPALQRKLRDVQVFESAIKRCVKVPLYQYEYDAYTNLTYNIGPTEFCGSTLVAVLNTQQYAQACNHILDFDRAGPVVKPKDRCSHPDNRTCRGVWYRRLRLHKQCLGEVLP